MISRKWILSILLIYLLNLNICQVNTFAAQETENNSSAGLVFSQREVLNSSNGLFGVLEWTFYQNESKIIFNLTKIVSTPRLNFVLGLSKTGNVERADFVVIRGDMLGPYKVENMYGTTKNIMEPNSGKNWRLENIENQEDRNITISLSRHISNCDLEDQTMSCIKTGMLYILWGFYQSLDTESPTFTLEGKIKTYLTDPQVLPPSPTDFQTWKVSRTYQIPSRQTSYWCNIQKAPLLPATHHIIGYAPYFADSTSKKHIHHQLLYRCVTPPGINSTQIFEPLLDFQGEECYLEETHQLPSQFCTEMVYAWNRGGKPFYFPQNVGIPLGQQIDEYFLLEIHYDNPKKVDKLKVESGINVLYSSNIRPIESSILLVGFGTLGLFTVPPNSTDFKIGGLCSSACTTNILTGEGATSIIAANLHAHRATHQIQLKHFRGDKELPSILFDNNYDASFQIMRLLENRVRILPGDQLGVECVMNTGNETILSGFSTRNEMCFAFLFIDKRSDYLYCSSEYPTGKTLDRYGIQKISWDKELQERVIRKAKNSPDLEGKTLQSVLDKDMRNWTENMRKDFEIEQMFGTHDSVCPPARKLVRLAYKTIGKENSERAERLKKFQKKIKLIPNTETVSTPSFMSRLCEWPKSRLRIEATSASSALTKIHLLCKLVMFVLTFYML